MTPEEKKECSGNSDRCFNPFGLKAHMYGLSVRNSLRKVPLTIKEIYECKKNDVICDSCRKSAYKELKEMES